MTSLKLSPSSLNEFLVAQKILPGQWDLLLFGDGSGLKWETGGGFACFLMDGRTLRRDLIIGGQTRTTVSRMELGVYTEAIAYHFYRLLDRVVTNAPYRVWIFSDSELTVKCGNKEYHRKTNVDLWQSFDIWEERGYLFRFRWVPRNSTPFHELADRLAGKARVALTALQLPAEQLYTYMPYTEEKVGQTAALPQCSKCRTPKLPTDKQCPICGHEEA